MPLGDVLPEVLTPKATVPRERIPNLVLKSCDLRSKNGKVGALTREERQEKLRKYFEKRKRRSFAKKISYDCRKIVADKRLRVKGRFVAKQNLK